MKPGRHFLFHNVFCEELIPKPIQNSLNKSALGMILLAHCSGAVYAQGEAQHTMQEQTSKALADTRSATRSVSGDGGVSKKSINSRVPTELDSILNFHKVHSYLYRGGAPDEEALKDLAGKFRVKTLIDLRNIGERKIDEAAIAKGLGMQYVSMPMSSAAPTQKQVDRFLQIVEAAKKDDAPVYVHCAHGSDRTGCLVGIWRVTHDGYDYDRAYKEMRKYFFGPKYTNLSGAVRERVLSPES
jgi:protein tyrosine phosphatase (PTP) superfamily phosphohydrolase (DUF442 family)